MTLAQQQLIDKYHSGQRLNYRDGVNLFELDLFVLGKMADERRKKLHGKKVFFNINRHINPTNICADSCSFCAFAASRKNPNSYTMSTEEILAIADEAAAGGATELHIVGSHNPNMGIDEYCELFSKLKERHPKLHIKAMTAAELYFLAQQSGLALSDILLRMSQSGVDSMPGGGAEIFNEIVRRKICPDKVSSDEWLQIHGIWHKMGHKSNATMLFGHVEERGHRVDHILRLRALQDETGGFNCFIPLAYQTENNFLEGVEPVTGHEILKTIAVSRILLDNIPHIKAYWVTSTVNLALVACEFGADDVDGTIMRESINAAAGAKSGSGLKLNELVHLIKDAGFEPVERDSLYGELKG